METGGCGCWRVHERLPEIRWDYSPMPAFPACARGRTITPAISPASQLRAPHSRLNCGGAWASGHPSCAMSAALYLLTICVRRSLAPLPPHAVVRASGRKRRILEDEYEVDRILERVVKKYSVEFLIAFKLRRRMGERSSIVCHECCPLPVNDLRAPFSRTPAPPCCGQGFRAKAPDPRR